MFDRRSFFKWLFSAPVAVSATAEIAETVEIPASGTLLPPSRGFTSWNFPATAITISLPYASSPFYTTTSYSPAKVAKMKLRSQMRSTMKEMGYE